MLSLQTRFDFARCGAIHAEDVRLLLAYIPFRKEPPKSPAGSSFSASRAAAKKSSVSNGDAAEGMFTEGRNMREEEREAQRERIEQFVGFVFEKQAALSLKQFAEMNTRVSSEMLVSVMAVLHERLPCSQYYFRQRRLFKERQITKFSKNRLPAINTELGQD